MGKFVSTEGNGGPPIVMSKEPIPKPDIPRGGLSLLHHASDQHHEDGTSTFTVRDARQGAGATLLLTYHRARRIAFDDLGFAVDVEPTTLVTWEYTA